MSLMLLLIGCLIPTVLFLFFFLLPGLVSKIINFIAFSIIVASAMLAVMGLREYAQGGYKHGKGQAIWTLILIGVIIFLPILGLAGLRLGMIELNRRPVGERTIRFDEQRFKFYAPGGRWIESQTNRLGEKATLTLYNASMDADFLIASEPSPRSDYSAEELAEQVLKTLREKFDQVRIAYRGPTGARSLEGVRLHTQLSKAGQSFYSEHRLFAATNGWTYRLTALGPAQKEEAIGEQLQNLVGRFELLESD